MISITEDFVKIKCDECGSILIDEMIDNKKGATFDISMETIHLHMHCQKCCAEHNRILAQSYQKSKSEENELLKIVTKHDIDITNLSIDEQIYFLKKLLGALKKEKKMIY